MGVITDNLVLTDKSINYSIFFICWNCQVQKEWVESNINHTSDITKNVLKK